MGMPDDAVDDAVDELMMMGLPTRGGMKFRMDL